MVHNVNITLDDEDYKKLLTEKNGLGWREFILKKCLGEEEIDG